MLESFTKDAVHIYIACGHTDFRKQIDGLSTLVRMKFKLDPYTPTSVFIFCNKRRNALKVLRYEKNGFILASKKLIKGMKYEWPRKSEEIRDITPQQVRWLLEGLEIEPRKAHREVKISMKASCY